MAFTPLTGSGVAGAYAVDDPFGVETVDLIRTNFNDHEDRVVDLEGAVIGTGDVVGPASAVGNTVALFDGTTGKLLKDSGIVLPGTPIDLDDLLDVVLGTPATGDVLTFNGSEWENAASASGGAPTGASYVTLATNGTLTSERVLTGTSNQVVVTDGGAGSTVTLSTPQNIHTSATPQFARLGLGAAADSSAVGKFAGQYYAPTHDDGNSSTADTIDWDTGNTHLSTLTGNCTFTFSNPKDGGRYLIALKQDGTGSRTVTWPSNVKWPSGTAPTLTTTAGHVDIVTLVYIAGIGASGNYLAASTLDFTPA